MRRFPKKCCRITLCLPFDECYYSKKNEIRKHIESDRILFKIVNSRRNPWNALDALGTVF